MGLMDGMLGGLVGAGVTAAIQNYIEKQGGLAAVISQFEQKGLGGLVQSWVGTGHNQPIAPHQMQDVVGADLLQKLSAKTGIPVPDLLQKLSQMLPETIDKMTPDGVVPGDRR
jgi:uncharacterized protein YidB (DUF937 family)